MRLAGWLERDLIGDTSAHEGATRLWLASAAKRAVLDPRVAGLSALVLLGALAGGCPAILLVIPIVYALRFALALLQGHARRDARKAASKAAVRLPSLQSFADMEARQLIERLERTRFAIENAASSGPALRGFAVDTLIEDIPQLERAILMLAARVEYLARFSDAATSVALRSEIVRLGHERREERDERAGAALEASLVTCQQHLDTLQNVAAKKEAALRTADRVLRTLEQTPALILSVQLARIESCDVFSADIEHRTELIRTGFASLEESLRSSGSSEEGATMAGAVR